MTRPAAQRILDAASQLGPADRALLSLLMNHGLNEETLARMMHLSAAAVMSRREQLVARLSSSLALQPAAVDAALQELAASARGRGAADPHAVAQDTGEERKPSATNGGPPPRAGGSAPLPDQPGPTPERAASVPRRRRRGAVAAAVALVLGVVLGVVLVVALSFGNADRAPRQAASTQSTALATGATPATPVTRVASARRVLAGLAGGPAGVTGSATVLGPSGNPRLALSASGLPEPGRGHYEVWLYNSVLDAVALVRIGAPGGKVTVALPPAYRHYRWVDISLQPPGSVNHSGESILRAALVQ